MHQLQIIFQPKYYFRMFNFKLIMNQRYIYSILIFLCLSNLKAQQSIKSTPINASLISVAYVYHQPLEDWATRWGNHSSLAFNYDFKLKQGLVLGAGYQFMFGAKLQEENPLSLVHLEGNLVSNEGLYKVMQTQLRGHNFEGRVGYLFKAKKPNPNSGLLVQLGAGYMFHKILHYYEGEPPRQISGDYLLGYDRGSNGLSLSQRVSYLHLDSRRWLNYSIGLEAIQGFTKFARGYDFASKSTLDIRRNDFMVGIRLAWFLPIYQETAENIFFF